MASEEERPLDPSERELSEEADAEEPGEVNPEELSPEELDRQITHCPHCGEERQEEDFGGRFCSTCGLSVWKYAGDDEGGEEEESEEDKVRCRFCGVYGVPPRCTQCGHVMSY